MEKARLTEFEEKCIQEEPAFCSAACPFHVDVKAFLGHMRNKDMDRAFKVIENALPVPDILARICDHPCEAHCIRNHLDAPVAIGDLERICAAGRTRRKKRFLPPAKGRTAGIWGSGLSSLTAAWDLSLKGYAVTMFDRTDALGGNLRGISSAVLPPEILANEIQVLKVFGVEFKTADSPDAAFPSRTDLSFDAVYIGEDSPGDPFTGFDRDDTGRPLVDGFSGGTSHPRIFAGGFLKNDPPLNTRSHPVAFAAHDFALQEMAHATGDTCFFARHAPGTNRSDQIFFPGCQLLGSAPDQVTQVYEFLLANLSGSIGFATGCCGAPARSAGVTIQELPAAGALTECCGFGGLVFNANPTLSQKINQQRAGQSDQDFLAYCAMYRDRLARVGKRTAHLLDLFWPQTDHPEQRKAPGFSSRHDNLAQVKHCMLAELWQEPPRNPTTKPLCVNPVTV